MSAPGRLAEIKQHADAMDPGRITTTVLDYRWLIAEVEQLHTAEAGFAQRLNDVRDEFQKRLQAAEPRTQQLRASHTRLLVNLQSLLQEVADPGTEALGAVYEAQQLATQYRVESGGER